MITSNFTPALWAGVILRVRDGYSHSVCETGTRWALASYFLTNKQVHE